MTVAETMTESATGGMKAMKEARYDLLPMKPLWEVAELYGRGAEKYDDNNWRRGYEFSKSFAALQRHAWLWWGGEETDPETGKSHMASVVFHAFALMEFHENFPEFDDRFKRDEPAPAPVEPVLKFKAGDRVREIASPHETGTVVEYRSRPTGDDAVWCEWDRQGVRMWCYEEELELISFEVGAKVRYKHPGGAGPDGALVGHISHDGPDDTWEVEWDVDWGPLLDGPWASTEPERMLEVVA